MRKLILMRHAKSSWDHPGLPDHDRPLNDRGRRSATAMGNWLRGKQHVPDSAIISSSRRTCETFEGLDFDVPLTVTRKLYHADAEQMLEVLRGAEDQETVLVIGHNPGIADFAGMLVRNAPDHLRFEDYPTCATLVVEFDTDHWNEIGWRQGQPIEFAIPREVMS